MTITGGCHCGKVRYRAEGEASNHALCHCTDCRRHAGAPMVGWTMYALDAVKVTQGQPKIYEPSANGRRHFCGDCGRGLFYTNSAVLPGIIDKAEVRVRRAARNPIHLGTNAHLSLDFANRGCSARAGQRGLARSAGIGVKR